MCSSSGISELSVGSRQRLDWLCYNARLGLPPMELVLLVIVSGVETRPYEFQRQEADIHRGRCGR